MRFLSIIVILCVAALGGHAADNLPQPGQMAANVACQQHPQETYAIAFPSDLRPGQQRPVLVLFSPGGNGKGVVRRFQAAADAYGWVVMASNQSRNGRDPAPTFQAITTELLSGRLPVDITRLYLGGLSGGARVSLSLAAQLHNPPPAGLIQAAAAKLNNVDQTTAVAESVTFVQIIGSGDYNFPEVMSYRHQLATAGRSTRMLDFNGGHNWGPERLTMTAIRRCELEYQLNQERPDHRQLRNLVGAELADIEQHRANDPQRWFDAVRWVRELDDQLAPLDNARLRRPVSVARTALEADPRLAAEEAGWDALIAAGTLDNDNPDTYRQMANRWLAVIDDHPNTTAAYKARWALQTCLIRTTQYAQASPRHREAFERQHTYINEQLGQREIPTSPDHR